MNRTYIPGYAATKVALILGGLALVALGLLQIRAPLAAALQGIRTVAIVLRVERTDARGEVTVYKTTQAIPADDTRSAVFRYVVEIETPGAPPRQALLALAHQVRPAYSCGDSVTICYRESAPELIYSVYDWSTWFLGLMLIVSGLIFGTAFLPLLMRARKATAIPDDIPGQAPP